MFTRTFISVICLCSVLTEGIEEKNSQKDYQAYRNYHFKIICLCVAFGNMFI